MEELSTESRLAAIEARLKYGDDRMDTMQADLAKNTALTQDVHAVMESARAGFRVIGGIGNAVALVAKWIAPVAIAVTAVYTAIYTLKNGHPPPKP